MLQPTVEDFIAHAESGRRVPLRTRIPADLETPVSAFLRLKPLGATFLLESVERGIQVGRYSFIGLSPYATIRLQNDTAQITRNGREERIAIDGRDPLGPVRAELQAPAGATALSPLEPLPGPFAGAVGYISYEIARYFERVPTPAGGGLGLPGYAFLFPSAMAVFDHVKSEIEIVVLPPAGDPGPAYAAASETIDALLRAFATPLPLRSGALPRAQHTLASFNMTPEEFKAKVLRIKDHILAGDVFQSVLSQRLHGRTTAPAFRIYRALRILNPSPYMFYIDFGDFQTVGSSPELLVKLEQRKATLCPIAGTRPRGTSPADDLRLEAELLANEKERAEHIMLVDLGRNDLGRVCEIGSVTPESLMLIEKYSHVMHIVSRISGTLRPELDMFDLLRATFPAGTVTGAPKVRAMEIISDLEKEARGLYAGGVGYLGRNGDMDMCIAIRTLILRGDEYIAQAGAGIVADSDPDAEYEETINKIGALTTAIAIAEKEF